MMKGSTGKFLLLVSVLVLIAAGAGLVYIKNNTKVAFGPEANFEKSDLLKSPEEAKEEIAKVAPVEAPNFTKTGYIQHQSDDEESESWRFLYEEPGNPAILANLNFNFRSKCDFGSGEQICNPKKFENGLFVQIEGTKSGDDVTVIRLKVLE